MLLFRPDNMGRQSVACRRGYDVVLMADHGAAPALGLELSEDAVSLFWRVQLFMLGLELAEGAVSL